MLKKDLIRQQKKNHIKGFTFIYFSILLINVIFFTTFADPFNTIKFVTLIISATWIIGYFIYNRFYLNKLKKIFLLLLACFISACFLSTIFSDNLYTSVIGENLRKNGLLTYISLSIFSAYFLCYFTYEKLKQFFSWIFFSNLICITYGFLQIFKQDPINWSGSGGIFSFYGNSNFAGTAYSIFFFLSIANIYFEKKLSKRSFISLVMIFDLICVYFTNARQSVLSIGVCLSILLAFLMYKWKKKIFYVYIVLLLPIGIGLLLGIFNRGPLSQFLFKESIRVRIFYWKASIEMLKDHPIFGVGLDRYGAYFKEYRDSAYPLNYGWDLTSTNAHNVPLQFFSTGGIFTGIFYCLIIFFISAQFFTKFSSLAKEKKLVVFCLFVSWLCYQFQSLFTVDNIAIAIWNWVLIGMLIGLLNESDYSPSKATPKISYDLFARLVAVLLIVPVIFLSFNLNRAESKVFKLMSTFSPNEPSTKDKFIGSATETLNIPFLDPTYQTIIGGYLIDYKNDVTGLDTLEKVFKSDKRNLQVLNALSVYHENKQEFQKALQYRFMIEKFDKWNAKNYLNIVNDSSALGNIKLAQDYADKIKSFADNTDVGESLQTLFPNL